MVTALLEYLNLLAILPWAYVALICSISINRLSYNTQTNLFFQNFILCSYFSEKKFWQNWRGLTSSLTLLKL